MSGSWRSPGGVTQVNTGWKLSCPEQPGLHSQPPLGPASCTMSIWRPLLTQELRVWATSQLVLLEWANTQHWYLVLSLSLSP